MAHTEEAPAVKFIVPDNAGKCFCTHPYVQVYQTIGIQIGTNSGPPPTAHCLLCDTRGYMDKFQVKRVGRTTNEYHFSPIITGDFTNSVIRLSTKEELEEAEKKSVKHILKFPDQ